MSVKAKKPEHVCRARVEADMWSPRPCGNRATVQDPNHPTEWYCGTHARQLIPGYENPAFAGTTPEERRQARLAKQKVKHPEDFCIVGGCLRRAFSFNGGVCGKHRDQARIVPDTADAAAEVQDLLSGKKGA